MYILSDKDIVKTCTLTNIKRPTIIKYITIKERLDFTLFSELDKRGKDKLTIGFALDLCKYVLNPDIQIIQYPELIKYPNKERKNQIIEMKKISILTLKLIFIK